MLRFSTEYYAGVGAIRITGSIEGGGLYADARSGTDARHEPFRRTLGWDSPNFLALSRELNNGSRSSVVMASSMADVPTALGLHIYDTLLVSRR
jgi:hypothetical protein